GVAGEVWLLAGQLVPFLARDLTGLAAGADRRIDEHALGHSVPPGRLPARMLPVKTLASWMLTFGSPTSALSSLTPSPFATPCQPQCQGRPIWCTVLPSMTKGRMRRVTSARACISPRLVLMVT